MSVELNQDFFEPATLNYFGLEVLQHFLARFYNIVHNII